MNTDTDTDAGVELGADRFWREPDFKWASLPRSGREWAFMGVALLAGWAFMVLIGAVGDALPYLWSFLFSALFICGCLVSVAVMVRSHRRIRGSKFSRWLRGEERPQAPTAPTQH